MFTTSVNGKMEILLLLMAHADVNMASEEKSCSFNKRYRDCQKHKASMETKNPKHYYINQCRNNLVYLRTF